MARAALGVAGATMLRDPGQMGLAIGIWGGCFSAGAVIGPLAGGAMLTHFWWGSVFLLGVPAMVLLVVAGPLLLPEYREPQPGRLDPTSVALSLAAVLPVVHGLKELAAAGLRAAPAASVLIGLFFAVVFVRRQRRLPYPLLDLRLFGNRSFSTALGGTMAATLLMGAIMLFIIQDLQLVEGLPPVPAREAFLGGLHLVAGVSAAVLAVVAVLIVRLLRDVPPTGVRPSATESTGEVRIRG